MLHRWRGEGVADLQAIDVGEADVEDDQVQPVGCDGEFEALMAGPAACSTTWWSSARSRVSERARRTSSSTTSRCIGTMVAQPSCKGDVRPRRESARARNRLLSCGSSAVGPSVTLSRCAVYPIHARTSSACSAAVAHMLWELSGSSGEGSRVLTVMSAAAKASIIVRFASTKGRPSARRLTLVAVRGAPVLK